MQTFVRLICLVAIASACRPATPGSPPAPSSSGAVPAPRQDIPLTATEARIRDAVLTHYEPSIALLQRSVDIPSGTNNLAGVRKVGDLFGAELRGLGFETRWETLPDSLHRAGHLIAVHPGTRGPRLLLIGHLDTVFEGQGQGWVREDTIARGAGTSDMKGGNVAMILALRALADAGQLKDMHITVIMTGDEESVGQPISVSRASMLDAARQSDLALAFEGGSATRVAIGRRGSSGWSLDVTGRQAHSS
nr:M20/M25/M40 family metallo-hydrolase [Gemmatimonadota bacterium]